MNLIKEYNIDAEKSSRVMERLRGAVVWGSEASIIIL